MSIELSVIIVNYNGRHYLKECLDSLATKLSRISYEIIVVDNNSGDGSCAYIRENHPSVQLIESPINLGFAKGNNEAVKHAKGKYLLLLNNDTVLLDELRPAINLLEDNKDIGVVGIKMLDSSGKYLPAVGNFPNVSNLFHMKRLHKLSQEFKDGVFSEPFYEVDWLGGSFLLLSNKLYNDISGFDEDYFLYVEDVDFCKKIADKGLKRVFMPHLRYIHHVGFTKKKNPLLIKGYRIYIKKNSEGANRLLMSFALNINAMVKRAKLGLKPD